MERQPDNAAGQPRRQDGRGPGQGRAGTADASAGTETAVACVVIRPLQCPLCGSVRARRYCTKRRTRYFRCDGCGGTFKGILAAPLCFSETDKRL